MGIVYKGKYHWQARSDTNMTKRICTEPLNIDGQDMYKFMMSKPITKQ